MPAVSPKINGISSDTGVRNKVSGFLCVFRVFSVTSVVNFTAVKFTTEVTENTEQKSETLA